MPFVDVLDHRLEYAEFPGVSGDLVLLHEGLGSVAMWRDFPGKLAQATGHRTIVYSRQGYGKSAPFSNPRDPLYMHRAAQEELPALRAALDIREPILIGHSDGGSIALIHAGAGNWPVKGLILEAPHVFVEDVSIAGIREAKTAYESGDLKRPLSRYHDDVDGAFWGWNEIWLSPQFRDWSIEEFLPSIHCPVLAIQGEDDQYGTLAQINAIGSGIKGPFEKLILSECGHAPHRDQEDDTLAAMVDFVRQVYKVT